MIMFSRLLIFSFLLSAGCSRAQAVSETNTDTAGNKNILIVYLSRTNNTRAIAEVIHSNVGGKLVALELVTPYPENYKATVDQVAGENASGFLPPLKTRIANMGQFDIVFLGFPTWGMQLPPPVKSFLKQYDLKGKIIVPFNTNAGYGTGNAFQTVKKMASGSKVLEGFSTRGGIERNGVYFVIKGEKEELAREEVRKWLGKIGLHSRR